MKHLLTISLIFLAFMAQAQRPDQNPRLESAKIGLITERLNLSSEQAQQFWPVYNELGERKKDLRRERAQATIGLDRNNISDSEARDLINRSMELKQRELDLEKEYAQKFQEVITPQQVLQLVKVEEDFRKFLLQKFRERQQQQNRGGGGR